MFGEKVLPHNSGLLPLESGRRAFISLEEAEQAGNPRVAWLLSNWKYCKARQGRKISGEK